MCLKSVDESGFERTSPLNYSYRLQGEHKRVHQPWRRGNGLLLWEYGNRNRASITA